VAGGSYWANSYWPGVYGAQNYWPKVFTPTPPPQPPYGWTSPWSPAFSVDFTGLVIIASPGPYWNASYWAASEWQRQYWPQFHPIPPMPPVVPPGPVTPALPFTIPGVYTPSPIYDWTTYPVSRIIKAVSYNGSTTAMVVSFTNGQQITYLGVIPYIAEAFRGAPAPDQFFVNNILGKFLSM